MAFNNFPYTDMHELNLDWIIMKLKELNGFYKQELTEEVKAFIRETLGDEFIHRIETAEDRIAYLESLKTYNEDWFVMFVDNVDGSDNNTGDSDHPLKSIDEAFRRFGTRPMASVRLVPRPSAYELSMLLSAGGELHMQSTTSAKAKVHVKGQCRWYNKYIHMTNLELSLDDTFQLEGGGMANLYGVTITRTNTAENAVAMLGGALVVHDGCVINGNTTIASGGTLVIPSVSNEFRNNNADKPTITLSGGSALVVKGCTVTNNAGGLAIEAERSNVNWQESRGSTSDVRCLVTGGIRLAMADVLSNVDTSSIPYINDKIVGTSTSYLLNGTFKASGTP